MTMMKKDSAFWMAHLEAIKREAISKTVYAERHGISVKRLYYWQRKLKATAAPRITSSSSKTFVELRVEDPVIAQREASCTLVLGSGIRMEISALPAPEWLAALERAAHRVR
jgi:hypothetical protein